jgi:hypothetical protein
MLPSLLIYPSLPSAFSANPIYEQYNTKIALVP